MKSLFKVSKNTEKTKSLRNQSSKIIVPSNTKLEEKNYNFTYKSEINDNVMNVKWIVNLLFWKIFKLSVFHTLCDRIHPTKSLYHLLNPSSHLNWPYARTMVGSSEFHPKSYVYFLFFYDLIHKSKLFWGSNSQRKDFMYDTVW